MVMKGAGIKLPTANWAALSTDLASELDGVRTDPGLGPLGRDMAGACLRRLRVNNAASMRQLANMLVLLEAAGSNETFFDSVRSLERIPFVGDYTVYEPVRQVVAGAYRRLHISHTATDPSVVGKFIGILCFDQPPEQLALVPRTSAMENRVEGRLVKEMRPFDAHLSKPSLYVANLAAEIRELWVMWCFGGSDAWPLTRIDAEISRRAAPFPEFRAVV